MNIPPEAYQNSEADCDFALGQFIRAWGQIEHAVFSLFHKLSGTDITTANIIFAAGIDQRTMRSICDALGKQRLKSSDYKCLEQFLRRMKTVATGRNRLMHGAWLLDIVLEGPGKTVKSAEWVRFYNPVDPEAYGQMAGRRPNQKVRDAHRYTLARIGTMTTEARQLGHQLRSFAADVVLLPVVVPQPVFLKQ